MESVRTEQNYEDNVHRKMAQFFYLTIPCLVRHNLPAFRPEFQSIIPGIQASRPLPRRRTWRHVTDHLVEGGDELAPIELPPRRRVGRPLGSRDSRPRAKRRSPACGHAPLPPHGSVVDSSAGSLTVSSAVLAAVAAAASRAYDRASPQPAAGPCSPCSTRSCLEDE
jgi:hypothetical protein